MNEFILPTEGSQAWAICMMAVGHVVSNASGHDFRILDGGIEMRQEGTRDWLPSWAIQKVEPFRVLIEDD